MRWFIITLTVYSITVAQAQQRISLEEAIRLGKEQNRSVRVSGFETEYQQHLRRTASDIGKTSIVYMRGQYNSYAKNDNNLTITQTIPFPSAIAAQNSLGKSLAKEAETNKTVTMNQVVYEIRKVYYQLNYLNALEDFLELQDSIYASFVKATELRFRTGESNLLEKTTAETQRNELLNTLAGVRSDIRILERSLQTLIGSDAPVTIIPSALTEYVVEIATDSTSIAKNPGLQFELQQTAVAMNERRLAAAHLMPDIIVGYFNQTLINTPINEGGNMATANDRFQGFQVGLAIPLWFVPQSARLRAAHIKEEKVKLQYENYRETLKGHWEQSLESYTANKRSVEYYRSSALKNADLIQKQSELAFRNGEIGYTEYWLAIRSAMQIHENYLASLNNLNQSIITLEFLSGK